MRSGVIYIIPGYYGNGALDEKAEAISRGDGWRAIEDAPAWDKRPANQFVRLEGECDHSGTSWPRTGFGTAGIDRTGPCGYREADIRRIAKDCDMHPLSATVTHWRPVDWAWKSMIAAAPPVPEGEE